MFDIKLINQNGQSLSFGAGSPFQVVDMSGLNPPPATINTSELALVDGAMFNSSKLQTRTINVAFAITSDAARNRAEVYRVLKSKQAIRFCYKGDVRDVYIDGYVESIDISFFEMMQVVTVAIFCPFPYFMEMTERVSDLSSIVPDFSAPFYSTEEPLIVFGHLASGESVVIENKGDVECGIIARFTAKGSVSDPKLYNYETQDFIGVDADLVEGDVVTIDTRQGKKGATLTRGTAVTNLFNKILPDSTWLQLPADGAAFVYDVESGDASDLSVEIEHSDLYEGV